MFDQLNNTVKVKRRKRRMNQWLILRVTNCWMMGWRWKISEGKFVWFSVFQVVSKFLVVIICPWL